MSSNLESWEPINAILNTYDTISAGNGVHNTNENFEFSSKMANSMTVWQLGNYKPACYDGQV